MSELFPFKIKKEDYLKTFDNIDALTFLTNGIDIFGTDFFEFLNDKTFKDNLAIKLFNESIDTNCWGFFRRIVSQYGVDTLLKIYNKDTLSKIDNDGHLYIVLASMMEKNLNYVLKYALTDNDFLSCLIKNSKYCYSLLFNIDYDLIKKYIIKDYDFVKNYFILSNDDYEKLFNDFDINEDILSKIITKINDINFVSNFFLNDKRSLNVFKRLNKNEINYLINNNVRFSKEIVKSDYLFESIKDESLIGFRNRINKITINSNYLDIENRVFNYYSSLLSDYNPSSNLFREYESIKEIKYPYNTNYILSSIALLDTSYDNLKELTNKKISEIVIDYLFKDNIYNVFINIRELLSYNDSLENKILSNDMVDFYKMILDIDKINDEDKIKLFYQFKNHRIDTIFYDYINALRKDSYNKFKDEVLHIDIKNKSNDLSSKYNVDIYDYRDKDFMILARVLRTPYEEDTNNYRDCFSLISNEHVELIYKDGKYIYGYNDFDVNRIMHVYEHDAYSSDISNSTRFINRIYRPSDLINASVKINEIQILNTKKDKRFESIKPSYIIAIDNITDMIIEESKRLNIPIILINEKHKKIVNSEIHTDYGRNISNNIFQDDVLYKYTDNNFVSKDEERERSKKR